MSESPWRSCAACTGCAAPCAWRSSRTLPDRFLPGSILYVEGQDAPLTVDWTGPSKPGLLVRFAEFTSREAVEPLRDRYLEVVLDAPLPEGSWYWHQIVGLEARTTDGEVLGTVLEVFRAGAGEVYVVGGGPRGRGARARRARHRHGAGPEEGRLVVDAVALDLPALVTAEDGPRATVRRRLTPGWPPIPAEPDDAGMPRRADAAGRADRRAGRRGDIRAGIGAAVRPSPR